MCVGREWFLIPEFALEKGSGWMVTGPVEGVCACVLEASTQSGVGIKEGKGALEQEIVGP